MTRSCVGCIDPWWQGFQDRSVSDPCTSSWALMGSEQNSSKMSRSYQRIETINSKTTHLPTLQHHKTSSNDTSRQTFSTSRPSSTTRRKARPQDPSRQQHSRRSANGRRLTFCLTGLRKIDDYGHQEQESTSARQPRPPTTTATTRHSVTGDRTNNCKTYSNTQQLQGPSTSRIPQERPSSPSRCDL